MAKSLFASKVFWVNTLTALAAGIAAVSGNFPEEYAGYATTALAILNVALRYVTTRPVTL